MSYNKCAYVIELSYKTFYIRRYGEKMKKRKKIKGMESVFLVFLFGIICISGGIANKLYYYNMKKKCTYQTTAYVSDVVRSRSTKGGDSITPVFTYEYKGKVYNTKGNTAIGPMGIKNAGSVILYLDPNDPETIYCPETDKATLFWILSGVGGIFFMLGILNITTNKRLNKYAKNKQKADELIFADINKE